MAISDAGAAARLIPALGANQPHPDVVAAYWDGIELGDAGWVLRRLDYRAESQTAVVSVETPGHRIVTVTYSLSPNLMRPGGVVERLARRVAELGHRDRCHGTSRLDELRMLLAARVRRATRVRVSFAPLPGLAVCAQPRPALRAVFWLMHTLTCDYGWVVGDLAQEVAGYGFSAEIPGECAAVFPASMPDDGSAAALLARTLPQLCGVELLWLTRYWVWHRDRCDRRPRRGWRSGDRIARTVVGQYICGSCANLSESGAISGESTAHTGRSSQSGRGGETAGVCARRQVVCGVDDDDDAYPLGKVRG
jgi:hypothetical protein